MIPDTPLYHFQKFFELLMQNELLVKDLFTWDYNGQRCFNLYVYGRKFSIGFDIETGGLVWRDIEYD